MHSKQPLPTHTPPSEAVTPVARRLFLEILRTQEQRGIETYGTTLRTHNGRDALRDLMEELVDAFQYVVQVRMENDDLRAENDELRNRLGAGTIPGVLPYGGIPAGPNPPLSYEGVPSVNLPESHPGYRIAPPVPSPGYAAVMHARGERACGQVAFYLAEPVYRGETADISKLRLLPDLRVPTPNDAPRCGSCSYPIDPYTNQDVEWEPHLRERLVKRVAVVRPSRSGPPEVLGGLFSAGVGQPRRDTRDPGTVQGEVSYPTDPIPGVSTVPDDLIELSRELRSETEG